MYTTPLLISPLQIRDLRLRNRIGMSPMCQYSAVDGVANDWHLVHLASRAVGGCGLIITEATGISSVGRISEQCLGLWNERQMTAFKPITAAIKANGAAAAVQLAHAGRKSNIQNPVQVDISTSEIQKITDEFTAACERALKAGFDAIEIHMAHGYLLNSFLSPLTNKRTDEFGGAIDNRMRFPLMVAESVRQAMPQGMPLLVRISASDWMDAGWTLDDSLVFAAELKRAGVDLIDCSSGGISSDAKIPLAPGYQLPFSQEIRKLGILTAGVGLICEAQQAEQVLQEMRADLVFLGRELLRNPYWALQAARQLGHDMEWPKQYLRSKI